MKNKLLITNFESCTDDGFWAKGLADNLISANSAIIRNINYDNIPNDYDSRLSPLVSEISSGIDTIIQYLPIDDIEYNFNYKNIVIYNGQHFIKRNLSILDKLSLADEIWVFDNQHKNYLDESFTDKVRVVGFPYSKDRISNHFSNKISKPKHETVFYTITDLTNIENLEILIYNFIVIFHQLHTRLIVYLKQTDQNYDIENIIKNTIDKIKNQMTIIDSSIIDDAITIISGNPYLTPEHQIECHAIGDCYINIDTNIGPDIFTASFLGKHILSIMNIDETISYKPEYILSTTPSNYRSFFGNRSYYNEFNSFPKIDDMSIQSKLILVYENIKNKLNTNNYYETFDQNKFFDINRITNEIPTRA